jgi:hypothetical protein
MSSAIQLIVLQANKKIVAGTALGHAKGLVAALREWSGCIMPDDQPIPARAVNIKLICDDLDTFLDSGLPNIDAVFVRVAPMARQYLSLLAIWPEEEHSKADAPVLVTLYILLRVSEDNYSAIYRALPTVFPL